MAVKIQVVPLHILAYFRACSFKQQTSMDELQTGEEALTLQKGIPQPWMLSTGNAITQCMDGAALALKYVLNLP